MTTARSPVPRGADELARGRRQHAGDRRSDDRRARPRALPDRRRAAGPAADAERATVHGSMAGRSLTTQTLLETALEDGALQLWVPVTEGAERLGVLRLTVDTLDEERRELDLAAEMQWSLLPPLTFTTSGTTVAGLLVRECGSRCATTPRSCRSSGAGRPSRSRPRGRRSSSRPSWTPRGAARPGSGPGGRRPPGRSRGCSSRRGSCAGTAGGRPRRSRTARLR